MGEGIQLALFGAFFDCDDQQAPRLRVPVVEQGESLAEFYRWALTTSCHYLRDVIVSNCPNNQVTGFCRL